MGRRRQAQMQLDDETKNFGAIMEASAGQTKCAAHHRISRAAFDGKQRTRTRRTPLWGYTGQISIWSRRENPRAKDSSTAPILPRLVAKEPRAQLFRSFGFHCMNHSFIDSNQIVFANPPFSHRFVIPKQNNDLSFVFLPPHRIPCAICISK